VLAAIGEALAQEGTEEGVTVLTLPKEAAGVTLRWSEKKQYLVWKVLFFEVVVLILLRFVLLERAKNQRKEQQAQMQLDYSDVVSKLLILLGSGMTLKQAWNRIATQYADKRKKNQIKKRWIYEEMLLTGHAIGDGESEPSAYRKFAERVGLGCYQRLVRILIQNLQTGSRGLCQLLEQESQTALEERKALARKLGEEAGTKMLLPLLLMLGIVIAIIMVPAMLSFQV
jgi:pilus assembly protein TadC